MGNTHEWKFTEHRLANKHSMALWSTSPVIGKIQIKTAMRFQLHHEISKKKKKKNNRHMILHDGVGNQATWYTAGVELNC